MSERAHNTDASELREMYQNEQALRSHTDTDVTTTGREYRNVYVELYPFHTRVVENRHDPIRETEYWLPNEQVINIKDGY